MHPATSNVTITNAFIFFTKVTTISANEDKDSRMFALS